MNTLPPTTKTLLTSLHLGKLKPFPGSWGSLPPVLLAGALAAVGLAPSTTDPAAPAYHAALIATLIVFSAVCLLHGDAAEAYYNRKDPSPVTADETAGQCIPLLFLPAVPAFDGPGATVVTLALAFLLFRLFDIAKPPPIGGLQRLPSGAGVLADDLAAGLAAAAVLQLITRVAM